MNFSTQIPITPYKHSIDYHSKVLSIGSCFAEHIGDKLKYFKFESHINPFGIIFNSVSIASLIERAVQQRYFTAEDVFYHNECWSCFEVHSELNHTDQAVFLENLNQQLQQLQQYLINASHIILTYGTSWVYRFKSSGLVVANCHKVKQSEFDKELLSISQIETSIQQTLDLIQAVNPNAKVMFTVSPVRHIKDGFVENQRSKAHLIAAIHQAIELNNSICYYFPSYEVLMDELRDYRFYAADLLHPNAIAVDYIWERFVESCISESDIETMRLVENIQKGLAHIPFNPNSASHLKFVENLQQKMIALQKQYPQIQF